MSLIRNFGLLLLMLAAANCTGARKIVYLPDGRSGYMTKCDSEGWQRCYQRATKICKRTGSGYDVLQKQHSPNVLFYSCKN